MEDIKKTHKHKKQTKSNQQTKTIKGLDREISWAAFTSMTQFLIHRKV